jgi:Tol biopolymer transport system component
MTLPLSRLVVALAALGAPIASTTTDDPPARPSFSEPSFSPDKREIVFSSGGDLWTVPASGGDARLLVSNPATERRPFFSPDGSRLAFTSTRTGNGDLYILTLANGNLERITFDDALDLLDGWSRDGKYLYFTSSSRDIAGNNDVFRVSAAGGTPMAVAGDRYAGEYWSSESPDGKTLAVTARGRVASDWWRKGHSHIDESEIWLVRGGAPGESNLSYSPITTAGAKSAWPMWSGDGATLYYVSDRSGNQNLWSRSLKGADEKQLTTFTSGRVVWPAASLDGSSIVFERDFGIWVYDRASNAAHQVSINLHGAPAGQSVDHLALSSGIRELALSPDAKKVAFIVHGEIFAAGSREGGDAARVTSTAGAEGQLEWAPDSRRLAYASDRNGASQIFLYDFGTRTETRLTDGPGDVTPFWSPDGKSIAYVRDGRELHILDVASKTDRRVAMGFLDRAPFLTERGIAWSPDGRWLAYLAPGGPKLFGNVMVVNAGGGEPRAVSFLPTVFSNSLSWSPDGTFLLVDAAQRTEPGQLIRVDLIPRPPRFREDQFRDLFPQQGPKQVSPALRPIDTTRTRPPATPARLDSSKSSSDSASAPKAGKRTEIVFDDIRRRSQSIPVGVDVNSQSISPDGKYVLLNASAAGQSNLYVYPLDELSRDDRVAKQITSTSGFKSSAQWSPDSKEVWFIENGRISSVNVDSRAAKPLAVSAEMDVDFAQEKIVVFDQAWRYLRDNFFRADMNGVDWNAARRTYLAQVEGARTTDEMRRAMQLMVGELNASHSGVNGPSTQSPYTGRIGLRFDRAEYERDGTLKIAEITPLGATALSNRIKVGDVLTAINGQPLARNRNVDELLSYRIGRQTTLSLRGPGGAYEVSVLPVSQATEKRLLYRGWVESRREYVAKASGGKLGYVHMLDMGEASLAQLFADLDAENTAREGVIIDVRNNNGGFVNAYALDVLTRRPYLRMQPRGLPATSARTQLGQRSLELPTVLVTNQQSLSDAEDFTEGYRAMQIGKVVGEPTAGWIIYTSDAGLLDGSSVRLPFIRVFDAQGKDMEMHPRPVDVEVIRPVGEEYSGKDSQLDAAVKTLLSQISH